VTTALHEILTRLERLYYSSQILRKSTLQFVAHTKFYLLLKESNLALLNVHTQDSDHEAIYDLQPI